MGRISISYETALKHPQIKEIETKLIKGKSKEKNSDLSELTWEYNWGESIPGKSFAELQASGWAKEKEPTAEEQIDRSFVFLCAKKNRWQASAKTPIYNGPTALPHYPISGQIPDEVRDLIVNCIKERQLEQQRIDSLTPEERQREIQELLTGLKKYPGFISVKI